MTEEKKNIDSLFKQQLDEFGYSPNDASWKLLQLKMSTSALKKKMIIIFSVVVPIVVLSIAAFFLNQKADVAYKVENTSSNLETSNVDPLASLKKKKPENKTNSTSSKSEQNNSENENLVAQQEELVETKEKIYINNISKSYAQSNFHEIIEKSKTSVNRGFLSELNSDFDEYAPVIKPNANFMFFTSRRPVSKKEIRKGVGRERIYYAEKTGNDWSAPKLIREPINTPNSFNSAVALSHDGDQLFIYRDDNYGNGDIFISEIKNASWSEPEPLPYPVNTKYHESTVTMSSDGNIIFFTSNRPGGQGGLDIWYAEKDKSGVWGDAKNLGDKINSDQHEEGVFLHPNNKTLFFSSKRDGGFGGYDIYYTHLENGEWSSPVNLGKEVNTENNDVYFMLDLKNEKAYFTSEKSGSNDKKDLFSINWEERLIFPSKETKSNSKLTASVNLQGDKGLKRNVKVEVGEIKSGKVIKQLALNKTDLNFEVDIEGDKDYWVTVTAEGYLPFYQEINATNLKNNIETDDYRIVKEISLAPLEEGSSFIIPLEVDKNGQLNLSKESSQTINQTAYFLSKNEGYQINIICNDENCKEKVLSILEKSEIPSQKIEFRDKHNFIIRPNDLKLLEKSKNQILIYISKN